MTFPFNVYLPAFVGAWGAALVTLPLWRRACHALDLVDDPGHRKLHARPIPLAGGLAVMSGMVISLLAGWLALRAGWVSGASGDPLAYGVGRRSAQLGAILCGALGMLGLGLLDDRYELEPRAKFSGQLLIAFMVATAGVRITLFVPSLFFSYAITILWILTVVNAFNFLDNMNGLCGGIGAIAAWAFAWTAAASGQYLVALLAGVICGALLGFLPYNFPRATAFLGDAGSHLVGYLMAVLAILPHFYTPDRPARAAVLTPLLILAVPLVDLVWVVWWRWEHGRPFYVGDTNHLSHQLVRRGWSPVSAVLTLWLASAAAGALAFL